MPQIQYDERDLDILTRTILGEAGSEPPEGQAAVAHVIVNRLRDPRWSKAGSIAGVALQPQQFSTWNKGAGGNSVGSGANPNSASYLRAKAIAEQVLSGSQPDMTGGATHYFSPKGMEALVKAGSQKNLIPKWWHTEAAKGKVVTIGGHNFAGKTAGADITSPVSFNPYGGLGAVDNSYVRPVDVYHSKTERDRVLAGGDPDDVFAFSEKEQQDQTFFNSDEGPGVLADGIVANMATVQMYLDHGAPPPDPDYETDVQQIEDLLTQGFPENWVRNITSEAHSQEHFDWLKNRYAQEAARNQRLEEAGWTGLGAEIFGAVADPLNWIVGLGAVSSGGKAIAGAKALQTTTRGGRALQVGAAAGAYNAVYEEVLRRHRPTVEAEQVIAAGALGVVVGGAIGAIQGPTSLITNKFAKSALQNYKKNVTDNFADPLTDSSSLSSPGSSVGAGVNPDIFNVSVPSKEIFDAADQLHANPAMMNNKFFRSIRTLGGAVDVVAQGKASKNPVSSMTWSILGEDAVGEVDRATPFSMTETERSIFRTRDTEFWKGYRPAWEAYAEEKGLTRLHPIKRIREENRFAHLARDHALLDGYDPHYRNDNPHVAAAAEAWRSNQKTLRSYMANPALAMGDDGTVRRPVANFDRIPEDNNYVALIRDGYKVDGALTQIGGYKGLVKHATEAFMQSGTVSRSLAKLRARIYADTMTAVDFHKDPRFRAVQETLDPTAFRETVDQLRDEGLLKVTDKEVETLVEDLVLRAKKAEGDGGVSPRAKKRTFNLDGYFAETSAMWKHPLTGKVQPFRLVDLYKDDLREIHSSYTREASGRISMARARVEDPMNPGEFLIDGITNDKEWNQLLKRIEDGWQETVNRGAHTPDEAEGLWKDDLIRLEWMRRKVLGHPDPTNFQKISEHLRMMRAYQFLRVMGQVGIAQLPEMMNILGQTGITNAMRAMPAFNSLIRNARTGKLKNSYMEELESAFGIGGERVRAEQFARHSDWSDTPNSMLQKPGFRKVDTAMRRGQQIIADVSLMAPVNTYLHRWGMNAMMHWWNKNAARAAEAGGDVRKALRKSEIKRLQALGLEPEMASRIYKQIEKFHKVDDTLNLDAWTDLEARAFFRQSSDRMMRRIIQENDPGSFAPWVSTEFAKILLQFRTFMLGSWSKQFLYNVRMADREMFVQFFGQMLVGAAAHAGQTQLRSVGRSDREEYLEKMLTPQALMLAGFQRGGWAAMFAFMADTGNFMAGGDPIFGYRSTGQKSMDVLFGNPSTGFLNDARELTKALRGFDGDVSQSDIRKTMKLMAAQNTIPLMLLTQILTQDLPSR